MINLRQRSNQKEIMDRQDIPFADMAQTLKELDIINTRLGGHAITISGLKHLYKNQNQLVIAEIGCGGGDNLAAINRYCVKKNIPVKFIGIDINQECVEFAKSKQAHLNAEWICIDYSKVTFDQKPDIIFTSLFCHHFSDEDLVFMLRWLHLNSTLGFFINDLHRHWLAYYLIKYITRFFSRSYLVKNDACISVARSFKKQDWQHLLSRADIPTHSIRWRWAFRWLVTAPGTQT